MASRERGPDARGAPGLGSHRRTDTPEARRRTPADPPLRDPTRYSQTDHFSERLAQQGRFVTRTVASEAIRRGQLRWNTTDGWRFALVRDGVRFVVVVGDTETASPVVVTAWTELADRDVALASDRWDAADVETIALRETLSDNAEDHVPDEIRPRQVSRPFPVGNHRIVTDAGAGHVECVTCGGHYRSKRDLVRSRCRR